MVNKQSRIELFVFLQRSIACLDPNPVCFGVRELLRVLFEPSQTGCLFCRIFFVLPSQRLHDAIESWLGLLEKPQPS